MVEMTSTTCAKPIEPLTSDKLMEMFNKMPPKTVIRFSSYLPDNGIFHGEMVNKILNCKQWEKGFLVPIKYREELIKEGFFEER